MMEAYDKQYPEYGFARHKGYPTKEHLEAIQIHGPCAIHRMTYSPLKQLDLETASNLNSSDIILNKSE